MWPSSNVWTTCVCIIRVSTAYPIVVSTIMLFGYRVLSVPWLGLKSLHSILTHAHNSSNRNGHVGLSTMLYMCIQMYIWPCTCIHIRMQQLKRMSTSLARFARFLKRFTRWPTQIDTYTRTFIIVRATQSSAQHAAMCMSTCHASSFSTLRETHRTIANIHIFLCIQRFFWMLSGTGIILNRLSRKMKQNLHACICALWYICTYAHTHAITCLLPTQKEGERAWPGVKNHPSQGLHTRYLHTQESNSQSTIQKRKINPICAKGLLPTNIGGWPRRNGVRRRTSHHSIIKVQVKKGIAMCAFCWLSKHSAHPSEDMT